METRKITQAEWLPEVTQCIMGGLHGILYGVIESSVAIVHRKTQVDEDTCNELGYEIIESFNNGGTILSSKGDVVIAHFYSPVNDWLKNFNAYFVEWLKSKGLSASCEKNDILVDGYKVCGTCITTYGRIDYSGVAISMNVNLDHIKAICKKPMVKVPKGLSEYGITTEEVEEMFLKFCEVN